MVPGKSTNAFQNNYQLTIAIPTYNRAPKLMRLLSILKREILLYNLERAVCILISDNASIDETEDSVRNFSAGDINMQYYKQESNVGFDNNILFLYQTTQTKYLWYMADDDFPLEGSIIRILETTIEYQPGVLLSSFIQPVGSDEKQFHYQNSVEIINNPKEAIENILNNTKMSMYVLRKVDFLETHNKLHSTSIGDGWMFAILAISILDVYSTPLMAVISDHLASCDEDVYQLDWIPAPYLTIHKMAQHPYVKHYSPELESRWIEIGYLACINLSWGLKTGSFSVKDEAGLNKFIRNLKFKPWILLKKPKLFLVLVVLKTNSPIFYSTVLKISGLLKKIVHSSRK
jgi:glycosyltransferase involved in cell wall biosynthesis